MVWLQALEVKLIIFVKNQNFMIKKNINLSKINILIYAYEKMSQIFVMDTQIKPLINMN